MAMKILITNDDGMHSPVLPELVRWARRYGDVTVVVPKTEQSGKSQTIEFRQPIEIRKREIAEDITVYAVDSTPADCVRFGITGLEQTYDLLLSGVNIGYNLGDDIAYSGTVGAILEGARLGVKGIALSAEFTATEVALEHLDDAMTFVLEHDLLSKNSLYNINFPKTAPKGIRITKQGGIYYHDRFVPQGSDLYLQVGEPLKRDNNDLSLDIDAVVCGYISVTPLTASKTEENVFEQLKDMRA